jgi:hypothetical protein
MSDRRLPKVTTRVTRVRPRHRVLADLRQTPPGAQELPEVRDGARVSVEVGAGLRVQELSRLAAIAEQLRCCGTVEIIGSNRQAVANARRMLLRLWERPLPAAAPSGLGSWADLLIGHASHRP